MNETVIPDTNADLSVAVTLDTRSMPWTASPRAGVERKPLDRRGGEMATRSTSVVRYAPGASFHGHDHPEGEEILVLDGVFSDEHGDYPAGSYLLNPPGFIHAPLSKEGCVIFVKLCQYGGSGRTHIAVDTNASPWKHGTAVGVEVMPLYAEDRHPEVVDLYRFAPGAEYVFDAKGGLEVFVRDGVLEDNDGRYPAGHWLRRPVGKGSKILRSGEGCTFYCKRGHLAGG